MTAVALKPYRQVLEGGRLRVNLHPGQTKAWDSQVRFIDMQSGTQGGKTCFGVDWLKREIDNCGEGDYLVVTATFPLLELKLLPEFLSVFRDLYHLGEFNDSKKIFTYCGGKVRVIFGSATNPESIESATAKAAWLDEAGQKQFRRDTWDAVQRRLSLFKGRVLFTTTIYGLGWLKAEIYDPWQRGEKDIEVIQFDSILNPAFPHDEYERMRSKMPAWKFDMFYRGRFTKPAGLIYDCFDTLTMVKSIGIGKDWPRYVGHDFGGANPAALFFAQDPTTGYFWAYEEYLPGPGRSTAQHAEEFKRISAGTNVIKRAGGSHQEEEIREAYRMHQWPISEPKFADKPGAVEAGIDRVYGLIKLGKLFVIPHLHHLIDELTTYSRKLDENFKPLDEIEDKSSFHLLDAARYILSDFTPETVGKYDELPVWRYR